MTHIREKTLKQRKANKYNSIAVSQKFQERDLVLRRANIGPQSPKQGKLASNWEGPYRIVKILGKGAYKLSTLSRFEVMEFFEPSKKFYMM